METKQTIYYTREEIENYANQLISYGVKFNYQIINNYTSKRYIKIIDQCINSDLKKCCKYEYTIYYNDDTLDIDFIIYDSISNYFNEYEHTHYTYCVKE